MNTAATHAIETEVTILARILDNEDGKLPQDLARYILDRNVSERDKARMHGLAARNQEDALTPEERVELVGFAKATSLLSLLKSKARRSLGLEPQSLTRS